MPKKRWNDLSPETRRLIMLGAAVDTVLKSVALVDLKRRPAGEVRGRKAWWAASIVLANSGGLVPIVYLRWGRTHRHEAAR